MRMQRALVTPAIALMIVLGSAGIAVGADVPLIEAVRTADPSAVKTLLNRHVDVNAPQADGTTALHWAADGDNV